MHLLTRIELAKAHTDPRIPKIYDIGQAFDAWPFYCQSTIKTADSRFIGRRRYLDLRHSTTTGTRH
jgi:hypothetical protein